MFCRILSLAFARYEEIKERSVTGLKYFVDQAKLRLDIDICIESSPIASKFYKITNDEH